MTDPQEIERLTAEDDNPIELPELLRLRGAARTAAEIAAANRRRAATHFADANRLLYEARELEALVRTAAELERMGGEDG